MTSSRSAARSSRASARSTGSKRSRGTWRRSPSCWRPVDDRGLRYARRRGRDARPVQAAHRVRGPLRELPRTAQPARRLRHLRAHRPECGRCAQARRRRSRRRGEVARCRDREEKGLPAVREGRARGVAMIRSVVLFSVKDGTRSEQIDAIVRAMKAIRFEGCSRWELVRDLRLREGNLPYAFVSDFDDATAYRAYDTDVEHNRIRRELLAPIAEK